jgi:hypothetical protein
MVSILEKLGSDFLELKARLKAGSGQERTSILRDENWSNILAAYFYSGYNTISFLPTHELSFAAVIQ